MDLEVVLALHTGLVESAYPAHDAEEAVVATVWEGAPPALALAAAAALDTVTDDVTILVTA